MNKPERITVAQAAALMGKSTAFVREGMKRGLLPIGMAQQLPGSTKYCFIISPPKLYAYLGMTSVNLPETDERGDLFTDEQIEVATKIFARSMMAAKKEVYSCGKDF